MWKVQCGIRATAKLISSSKSLTVETHELWIWLQEKVILLNFQKYSHYRFQKYRHKYRNRYRHFESFILEAWYSYSALQWNGLKKVIFFSFKIPLLILFYWFCKATLCAWTIPLMQNPSVYSTENCLIISLSIHGWVISIKSLSACNNNIVCLCKLSWLRVCIPFSQSLMLTALWWVVQSTALS